MGASVTDFLNTFSGPTMESYWFYDGTSELRFDKESWTYYLVGELGNLIAQYGVTSVIKIIDKSDMLVPWASKMCMEKMLRTIPTNLLMTDENDPHPLIYIPSMSLAEFTRLALEAKAAHRERLEDAGTVGHMAHACLESSIKYALANDPDKMVRVLVEQPADPRAVSCASAAFNWMQAHRVRWQHTEKKIYSREHGYAGTMDGLATYDSCTNKACCAEQFRDKLFIADWKTSNALRREYILQVSAYRHAYMEEHGVFIEHGVVLRLGKEDGEFESLQLGVEDFEAGFSGFLDCLALLKDVEKVDERWKAKKDYRKVAQKEAKALAKEQAKEEEKAAKAEARAALKLRTAEAKRLLKEQAKANREAAKVEAKRLKEEHTALKALEKAGAPKVPTLTLTPESSKVFVEAILNPPEPNEALKEAAKACISVKDTVESKIEGIAYE